jgi:hypothetical protein
MTMFGNFGNRGFAVLVRGESELEAIIVGLVDAALAGVRQPARRQALVRQAMRLSRRTANPLVKIQLMQALRKGEALTTLTDLQRLVDRLQAERRVVYPVSRHFGRSSSTEAGRGGEPMLTPGEVARELGVSPKTVTNWCKQGLLRCEVLESGHRRIPASALGAYRASQARWQRVDATRGEAPAIDDDAIFAEIAARRRG